MRLGFFANEEFTAENPLGIGASKPHYRRARWPAAYAFGIEQWDGMQCIEGEREGPVSTVREWVGAAATHMAFAETNPSPRYVPGLETVAQRFEELAHPLAFADALPVHILRGTFNH